MKFEKLKPGMTVYDVGRSKMGNTTISTVSVWAVQIVGVDVERRTVEACWNGNYARVYHEGTYKKWREHQPMTVDTGFFGRRRLATRAEIAAAKASAETPNTGGKPPREPRSA